MVDDFSVKYVGKNTARNLIDTLKEQCIMSIDWGGKNYLEFKLDWDYEKGTFTLSIPEYMPKSLCCFQYLKLLKPMYLLEKFE